MYFIAILVALGLLQHWGTAAPLHNDHWFQQWQQKMPLAPVGARIALTVGLPCLALLLVLELFGHWFWGMIELGLSVLVLMYAFGRGEYKQKLIAYSDAWREEHYESLPAIIQSVDPDYIPHVDEGVQQTHVAARDSFLYAGFSRLFVVLFWFVLLGPVAALFYRLLCLMQVQADDESLVVLRRLRQWIEWPAGRLMGLTFAFVGDFGKAISSWMSTVLHAGMSTRQVLCANAMAALDQNMNWVTGKFSETHTLPQQAGLAADEVKDIQQLLNRSLIFAVVVIAVYQIFI